MVQLPQPIDPASRSIRTPSHQTLSISRIPSASKGGCWTCRLRRKKCDEQREGDSCRTCMRLTIKCLGWGPKRPEWMRDKQAVEAYKADIKAQLTRAGLIRGQPRSSFRSNPPSASPEQPRSELYHSHSATDATTPSTQPFDHPDYRYNYLNPLQRQHQTDDHKMIPNMPAFHQIADYHDPTFNGLDLHTPFFPYPPSVTPISSSSDSLNLDFSHLGGPEQSTFEFDLRPASPLAPSSSFPVGQSTSVQEHIIYYFEHVRKIQLIFAGNTFTNATYSTIVQEPTGAVANAVCALASLHFTRKRVAEGLEAPDPNPEHSYAMYFYNEALFQLDAARHVRHLNESDALAALHLVVFSQLSGGETVWQPAFQVMCDWLATTSLLTKDNPSSSLRALSPSGQLLVKTTLWFDTFSSVTQFRPPKYFGLLKKLMGGQDSIAAAEKHHFLRMDLVTGCPDEVLLAFAEAATLAHWKVTEQRNRTMSSRELVRRGDEIENRLRQHQSEALSSSGVDQAPLHPNVPSTGPIGEVDTPFPDEESRPLVAKIFCEAAILFLNMILSSANPGVAEIRESVEKTMQLLKQLIPSNVDRALVFPICLAGSMSDDCDHRDLFRERLQSLDGSVGNVVQTCSVMEAVWRKRDVTAGTVDFRETLRDQSPKLLLI